MAGERVLERIRELGPTISKRSEEIEDARRIPVDLVQDLVAAGCFRLGLPAKYGGEELDLPTILKVFEELSAFDASVGWTVMIGGGAPDILSLLPAAVFERLYAAGPDLLAGGTLAPKGTAVVVDGGYRVTGQWPFASGCLHSTWLCANCIVIENGEPRPGPLGVDIRCMALPTEQWEIIDNWRVVGLRGTGSHDIKLADVFVPEEQSFDLFGGTSSIEGRLFRIPILGKFALDLAAVAVGIAQSSLDDIVALAAGGKRPAFAGPVRLADSPHFQFQLGRAEATLRAARALLYATAEEAWAAAGADEQAGPLERARMRTAGPRIVELALEVVDTAHRLGGGSAVYERSPLPRHLRDIHTLSQHAGIAPDFYAVVGSGLVGNDLSGARI